MAKELTNYIISPETHIIVTDEINNLSLFEDGKVTLFNQNTCEIVIVDLTEEIGEMFGLAIQEDPIPPRAKTPSSAKLVENVDNDLLEQISLPEMSVQSDPVPTSQCSTTRKKKIAEWSPNSIRALIGYYGDNTDDFVSTRVRNDTVWNKIALSLSSDNYSYSGIQCKNKFFNLKSEYISKVENMRNDKNTGAQRVDFNYFEEFDSMFGKKPNVCPQNVASSSRGCMNQLNPSDDHLNQSDNDSSQPVKKKRKVTPTDIMDSYAENRSSRERRHQDKMKVQNKVLDQMSSLILVLNSAFKKGQDEKDKENEPKN